MHTDQRSRPTFEITHDTDPAQHLIAGFSTFGLAGLTAIDYLTTELALEETGYITVDELPAITPFADGTPRHHTRLYAHGDHGVTTLLNELFVPPWAADAFSEAILTWADEHGVEEITILSGVPVPHGPEDHRAFYVATADYQADRLAEGDLPPMGAGFLDGVNASLVGQGLDTALKVGVIITPVHAQAPDGEAALRLVEAVDDLYALDVDTAKLAEFAAEVEQYYAELAQRFEQLADEERAPDQMFM